MVAYVGSKRRIANDILSVIQRENNQTWVEPFCGGCNMLERVTNPRIANDSNVYVVAMFRAVVAGWIPPEIITEQQYSEIKQHQEDYPPELIGFVGIGCSWGRKWWGGYGRQSRGNYGAEFKRSLLRQAPLLQDVQWSAVDYRDMTIPPGSIVYCDPPYQHTTNGYATSGFNHDDFWSWCRGVAKIATVYVSEYTAPRWVDCV